MLLVGFILGGYLGYRVFDGSPAWTLIVGVSFGVLVAFLEGRAMRHPDWVERAKARQAARPGIRKALLRLAIPFLVLVVAFVVGEVAQSVHAFIVAAAIGLALGLALRFTVLR